MRNTAALALGFGLFLLAHPAHAEETSSTSRIVAVGLFKNGLAVIKREVTVGGPGTYVLDDVPEPVHGTFWIESSAPIEASVQMREVDVPAEQTVLGNPQEDLAGKKVTIQFKGGKLPPATGTMMRLKLSKHDAQPSRFLILQTTKGRTYVEASEIASIEAEGAGENVKRRQPRLVLTVGPTETKSNKVFISYLTRGLSWAPSYRVDITDPKTLALEQHAVIKNELADLRGADIKLISGFPSVQFSQVTSPLAARTSWAQFFQELSQRGWREPDAMANTVVAQQPAPMYNLPRPQDLSATPAGEGVDVHYQSIGTRTLADGDALELTVAKGQSAYERIVEWLVPDTRNEYGHHAGAPYGRGGSDDEAHDTAWDALKFRNPFPFPMTTGPATVTADGKFNGQRTTFWVNAGEETVLHVNKALSIRTRAIEHEEQKKNGEDSRDFIWVGGRQFRRSTVEGELSVSNHRKETIQLVIRRRFSGELLHADGEPKSSLREEGVYSVNKRNELQWTLALKPGEERKLTYRYTVLVAN